MSLIRCFPVIGLAKWLMLSACLCLTLIWSISLFSTLYYDPGGCGQTDFYSRVLAAGSLYRCGEQECGCCDEWQVQWPGSEQVPEEWIRIDSSPVRQGISSQDNPRQLPSACGGDPLMALCRRFHRGDGLAVSYWSATAFVKEASDFCCRLSVCRRRYACGRRRGGSTLCVVDGALAFEKDGAPAYVVVWGCFAA